MKKAIGILPLLFFGSAVLAQPVQQSSITPPAQPPQGAYVIPGPPSPVVQADGKITFSLYAPTASSVSVDGDYPIGNGYRNGKSVRPMTKDDKGVWSITVGPLKPEIYYYYFLVDGVPTLDPHNVRTGRDGDHYGNWAVVPGPGSANYLINDVPHGEVRQVWYPSPTLGMTRRLIVYTPPGYEKSSERYPVFYLLHGGGGDEEAWVDLGRAPAIFDNLTAQGKMRPAIVAIFNGNGTQTAAPNQLTAKLNNSQTASISDLNWGKTPAGGAAAQPAPATPQGSWNNPVNYKRNSDSFAHDMVSYMDSNYRTRADADDRAIAGLSAGGAMTLYTAMNNLDTFSWVGVFAGGLTGLPGASKAIDMPADAARRRGPDAGRSFDPEKYSALMPAIGPGVNAKLHLLFLTIGDDDGLLEAYYDLRKYLDEKGVKYVWSEIPGYGHEWPFWRINLVDFSQKIFQSAAK